MVDTTIISICVLALVLIAGIVIAIKKFFALSKEERKDRIINWLTGAVVTAQRLIDKDIIGANEEKFNQVVNEFKTKAPLLYKIFIKFTNGLELGDLIEEALKNVKDAKF